MQRLTMEEKVALLAGTDIWHTPPIARLGIGAIKTSDGPSGVRGKFAVDGPKAAFVPGPVCQAATWSLSQIYSLGRLLCKEAKTKSAHVLLAPTICCARNPLGGRNFECFGEDPFLSGRLAVEYVKGVQESGEVAATPKHFVANEQEHLRFNINAVISDKALREIYLRPFEVLICSASPPDCIMTSYNCVNGEHLDMNSRIIRDILRGEWGFKGLVMSDWGGTNSTLESLLAGLDLEMPGPPERRGRKLLDAIEQSNYDPKLMAALDESVVRVLRLARKHGLLGLSPEDAEKTRDSQEISCTTPEDIKLMRDIAASGIVLLKNSQQTLPLKARSLAGKQVAFIGPNALDGTPGGGGSATMNPQYLSRPMESFRAVAMTHGIDVTVKHTLGAYARKWLPLFSESQWAVNGHNPSQNLVRVDYYLSNDLSGPTKETQFRGSSNVDMSDSSPLDFQVDPVPAYSFRITSTVTPSKSGRHTFSLSSVGGSRLYVDGKLIIDNGSWTEPGETFYAFGSAEATGTTKMETHQKYNITVEGWATRPDGIYTADANHVFAAHPSVRIGYLEELPTPEAMIDEAVALADESDATIVVIGLSDEWESEGYDRKDMALPGAQNQLVEALAKRAKRPHSIVYVNQSGSPVEVPWIHDVSTFVQAWYGGQEAGNALADVLLGYTNPSGRLPCTWPQKYSDLPFEADPESWPGVGETVLYKEETQVGYRWFNHNPDVTPQWWFGFGLSYTSFSTTLIRVRESEDSWTVHVDVDNTGAYPGQQIVQVYVWPNQTPQDKALVGIEKTSLIQPGNRECVTLNIRTRDAARWVSGRWVIDGGIYSLGVGTGVGEASDSVISLDVKGHSWGPEEY
ncbi:glycoside hydrolase superfamily [Stachybotrys elegans]|uniref:beta-glucosidase n=1 Tax=Stachybotrys elegans TaxID=80388 RepID=A0A8K0SFD0_9HYPO|nr:glycoside hydrolase superfamily [Stachybotrys elegans]